MNGLLRPWLQVESVHRIRMRSSQAMFQIARRRLDVVGERV